MTNITGLLSSSLITVQTSVVLSLTVSRVRVYVKGPKTCDDARSRLLAMGAQLTSYNHAPPMFHLPNFGYSKPRLRTKFAERAFSFFGPTEWNCLLNDLRMITDTTM